MDDADRAAELQRREIEAGIARVNREVRLRGDGERVICKSCGNPIPEARRRARPGCETCIDCQREQEGS